MREDCTVVVGMGMNVVIPRLRVFFILTRGIHINAVCDIVQNAYIINGLDIHST